MASIAEMRTRLNALEKKVEQINRIVYNISHQIDISNKTPPMVKKKKEN